ncbi:hypothetical protein [Streptomyces sp. NPDC029554]
MERFPGYTLSSLMDEDTELMRLIAIERLGTPDTPEGGPDE